MNPNLSGEQFGTQLIDNHTGESRSYARGVSKEFAALNAHLWRKTLDPHRFSAAVVPARRV